VAQDPAFTRMRAVRWNVQVTAGAQATANLMLALDTSSTGGTDSTGVDTTGAGGSPTGPVVRVAISPLTQTIAVGDSAGAIATTYNAQSQMLTGRTVTWTLSDSSVVSVTAAAYNWILLRGAHSGTVTLTAASEGVKATATVAVR
jgi:hypothetical protein